MARQGVFSIPKELKDEDKWFRYFSKKQAAVLVLTGILDYRILLFANANGILLPIIICTVLFSLLIVGIVMIELPVDALFLQGGGITMDLWILRVMIRKYRKEIYVKNYIPIEEDTL